MDLKKMSVTDLKALVYDNMAQIELCQNNMKIINAEIAEKIREEKKPKEEEDVKVS